MRVSLFITCLVDQMFPDVGEAMVRTLRRLGVEVGFNDAQTCCGQVAFNTGYRPETRAMAEHFLRVFENDKADFIVAPSGSCTAMVRNSMANYFMELTISSGANGWARSGHVCASSQNLSSTNWVRKTWARASLPGSPITTPVICCVSWEFPISRDV